jgi:hypothetical protein
MGSPSKGGEPFLFQYGFLRGFAIIGTYNYKQQIHIYAIATSSYIRLRHGREKNI